MSDPIANLIGNEKRREEERVVDSSAIDDWRLDLRPLRLRLGMPIGATARLAGITRGYLWKIERAEAEPTVKVARQLAAALRVPLIELLGPSTAVTREVGAPTRGPSLGQPEGYVEDAPRLPVESQAGIGTAQRIYYGDCDGVGWTEGEVTIQTKCTRCGGDGWEPTA